MSSLCVQSCGVGIECTEVGVDAVWVMVSSCSSLTECWDREEPKTLGGRLTFCRLLGLERGMILSILGLWRREELSRSKGEELEGVAADSAPDSEVVGLDEKNEEARLFF